MVYCRKLKDAKCEVSNGVCIVKNPKTVEDYKICPERLLAKDYSEMSIGEKAFHNSIQNEKRICKIEKKLSELSKEIEEESNKTFLNYASDTFLDYASFSTRLYLLEHNNSEKKKKKKGILEWLHLRK